MKDQNSSPSPAIQTIRNPALMDGSAEFQALDRFLADNRETPSLNMIVLQKAQEIFGYLPLEVIRYISAEISVPIGELYGIATFYSQFSTVPQGKHKISVCLGTACYIKGAQKVLDKVAELLNIRPGETTEDRLFTLQSARCLGCCSLSPVMMIDEKVYANLVNMDDIADILDSYRPADEEVMLSIQDSEPDEPNGQADIKEE